MSEKLSPKRLRHIRKEHKRLSFGPVVDDLLFHIAAQDEEIEQLRAVHEAELGVCEQHCEVVKRLRGLLREWTDMDPLRWDSEAPCPWCNFDYAKMQHELDCPFVLARVECGIGAGTKALGGEA